LKSNDWRLKIKIFFYYINIFDYEIRAFWNYANNVVRIVKYPITFELLSL